MLRHIIRTNARGGHGRRLMGVAGVVLLGLTLLLAACGPQQAKENKDVVVIGGVGPLSQPGAVQAGMDMKWAMETAVADVNGEGGVLGKTLKLIFYDTQNQPDVAASIAERLVNEDKVVAVVGEYHSGAALAQIPTYNKARLPVIFSETWSDKITGGDPDSPDLPANPPTIFRIAPTSTYAGRLLSDWLINGLHAKKVVELYEATDFGVSQARAMKEQLEEAGVALVQIQVELNQTDYSPILARLAEENPDANAVIFDVTGESSYVIEQNAFEVGLVKKGIVPVVNQVAQDSPAFWRAVPDGTGSAFRLVGLTPSMYNDLTRSVAERFTEKFGGSPKVWVFESYDSVRLIADAIKRAGSTDADKIVKALETTSFVGAQGKYEFPYNSSNPVPSDKPGWMWHQWPNPPIQIVEYFAKDQALNDAAVVWPPQRQTHGKPYVEP